MPKTKHRTSGTADANSLAVIHKLIDLGVFEEHGYVAQGVIDNWYEKDCIGRLGWWNSKKKEFKVTHFKKPRHSFDAIDYVCGNSQILSRKYERPRRWYDTKPLLRLYMMLVALKHAGVPYRKLTFYIGEELVEASKAAGQPLAGYVNKRISRTLKALLGDVEFGVWFHIEPTPEKSAKRPPYHAHGIIFIADPSWFIRHSNKRKKLGRAFLKATGKDETMCPQNWQEMKEQDLNFGWIDYSRKGRRDRLFIMDFEICPEEVGDPLSAMSHAMTRRAKGFYERLLPLIRAIVENKYPEFSADDWRKLNEGYDHPLWFLPAAE